MAKCDVCSVSIPDGEKLCPKCSLDKQAKRAIKVEKVLDAMKKTGPYILSLLVIIAKRVRK